jgi:ribosomal protein S18 acetylase RimI-like enzyme
VESIGKENLTNVMELIRRVIAGMRSNNIDQWDEIYPDCDTVKCDIEEKCAYGVFEQKLLLGYISVNEEFPREYDSVAWKGNVGKNLIIHRLCVHPDYTGRGIGRCLLNFAEEYALKSNYSSIRLDAFCKNQRAVEFYERNGYEKVGRVQFRTGDFFCYEKERAAFSLE